MKGILIALVVMGHAKTDIIHDIIFLFHMPLFFILSGYLLKSDKISNLSYLKSRAKALLIPYGVYLVIDFIVIQHNISLSNVIHLIWGGRAISGTYWFITTFIVSLFIFEFIVSNFSTRVVICLAIIGGQCSNGI
jgi:fucose 4-O-acetylase-like acetyltransferase